VTYKPGCYPDEIKNVIANFNCLIVRSETKVDAQLISAMEKWKL